MLLLACFKLVQLLACFTLVLACFMLAFARIRSWIHLIGTWIEKNKVPSHRGKSCSQRRGDPGWQRLRGHNMCRQRQDGKQYRVRGHGGPGPGGNDDIVYGPLLWAIQHSWQDLRKVDSYRSGNSCPDNITSWVNLCWLLCKGSTWALLFCRFLGVMN